MKYLEITKEKFEAMVPVMRNASEGVWTGVQAGLEAAEDALVDVVGLELMGELAQDVLLLNEMRLVVSLGGARRAVAGLDVVLTDVGFGVVKNQNLVPASRERVGAVVEDLRRSESDAMDALLRRLLRGGWWGRTSAGRRRVDSLLWESRRLRSLGVKLDGRDVYEDERVALQAQIREAEGMAERIVSPELMAELLRREREAGEDVEFQYVLVRQAVRRFMAVVLHPERPGLDGAGRQLLALVEREAWRLPEYERSGTRRALRMSDYANGRDDASFFF
ncbi:MAG: hypothetical protein IKZ20_03150 [Bacteroidaceae bacterium]|nr:hypothetical protein [Bacteroidaceae bacterium]